MSDDETTPSGASRDGKKDRAASQTKRPTEVPKVPKTPAKKPAAKKKAVAKKKADPEPPVEPLPGADLPYMIKRDTFEKMGFVHWKVFVLMQYIRALVGNRTELESWYLQDKYDPAPSVGILSVLLEIVPEKKMLYDHLLTDEGRKNTSLQTFFEHLDRGHIVPKADLINDAIVAVMETLKADGKMTPKTVHNAIANLKTPDYVVEAFRTWGQDIKKISKACREGKHDKCKTKTCGDSCHKKAGLADVPTLSDNAPKTTAAPTPAAAPIQEVEEGTIGLGFMKVAEQGEFVTEEKTIYSTKFRADKVGTSLSVKSGDRRKAEALVRAQGSMDIGDSFPMGMQPIRVLDEHNAQEFEVTSIQLKNGGKSATLHITDKAVIGSLLGDGRLFRIIRTGSSQTQARFDMGDTESPSNEDDEDQE